MRPRLPRRSTPARSAYSLAALRQRKEEEMEVQAEEAKREAAELALQRDDEPESCPCCRWQFYGDFAWILPASSW